jgi:hypothetical protein
VAKLSVDRLSVLLTCIKGQGARQAMLQAAAKAIIAQQREALVNALDFGQMLGRKALLAFTRSGVLPLRRPATRRRWNRG